MTSIMRGNRRADTRPEAALRSYLHGLGFRFWKDHLIRAGDVRVKADIVFPRARLAVFVDGCFWHACPEHGRRPRKNTRYWDAKLDRNIARDARVTEALLSDDWRVLRFWEHTPSAEAGVIVACALRAEASHRASAVG